MRLLIFILLAAVALTGISLMLGRQLQDPVDATTRIERQPETITDPVGFGVVEEIIVTRATLVPERTYPVKAPTDVPTVITGLPLRVNEVIHQGHLIVELAGRPMFLLSGSFPTWRAFTRGMTPGPDVKLLQTALTELGFYHGEVDGTLGHGTELAIRAFFAAAGYALDSSSLHVPHWTFVFVPTPSARVEHLGGGLGDILTDDTIVLGSPDRGIQVQLASALADRLRVGTYVRLRHENAKIAIEGSISRVDLSAADDGGGALAHFVIDTPVDFLESQDITAEIVIASSHEPSLHVSPFALAIDSEGRPYVIKVTETGSVQVQIEVVLVSPDRVAISSPDLMEGDLLILFPEASRAP